MTFSTTVHRRRDGLDCQLRVRSRRGLCHPEQGRNSKRRSRGDREPRGGGDRCREESEEMTQRIEGRSRYTTADVTGVLSQKCREEMNTNGGPTNLREYRDSWFT